MASPSKMSASNSNQKIHVDSQNNATLNKTSSRITTVDKKFDEAHKLLNKLQSLYKNNDVHHQNKTIFETVFEISTKLEMSIENVEGNTVYPKLKHKFLNGYNTNTTEEDRDRIAKEFLSQPLSILLKKAVEEKEENVIKYSNSSTISLIDFLKKESEVVKLIMNFNKKLDAGEAVDTILSEFRKTEKNSDGLRAGISLSYMQDNLMEMTREREEKDSVEAFFGALKEMFTVTNIVSSQLIDKKI